MSQEKDGDSIDIIMTESSLQISTATIGSYGALEVEYDISDDKAKELHQALTEYLENKGILCQKKLV